MIGQAADIIASLTTMTVLLLVAGAIYSQAIIATDLADGVDSYVCWLPGNPWFKPDPIRLVIDGCAWSEPKLAVR